MIEKEIKSYKPTKRNEVELFGEPSVLTGNFPAPRRPGDTSYDPKWAYALSVISAWAYAEGQDLADKLFFYGFPDCTVHQISVTNKALTIVATAFVIVDQKSGVGILAFRGTEPDNMINWLTDADSAKYAFGRRDNVDAGDAGVEYVHSGFYANVEAVWVDIVEILNPAIRDDVVRDLYITGHSLGAAMNVIAAARIWKNLNGPYQEWQKRMRGIYSFAQPAVGDRDFASRYDNRFGDFLYRHIYDEDIVPCLPPTSVDTSFEQFGQRFVASSFHESWKPGGDERRATLVEVGSVLTSFIVRRIDQLERFKNLLRPLVPYSLDDHSPRGYVEVSRNTAAPGARRALRVGLQRPPLLSQLIADIARPVTTIAATLPRLSIELIGGLTGPVGALVNAVPRLLAGNGTAGRSNGHPPGA